MSDSNNYYASSEYDEIEFQYNVKTKSFTLKIGVFIFDFGEEATQKLKIFLDKNIKESS